MEWLLSGLEKEGGRACSNSPNIFIISNFGFPQIPLARIAVVTSFTDSVTFSGGVEKGEFLAPRPPEGGWEGGAPPRRAPPAIVPAPPVYGGAPPAPPEKPANLAEAWRSLRPTGFLLAHFSLEEATAFCFADLETKGSL